MSEQQPSGFKRVKLSGSEELFRDTRADAPAVPEPPPAALGVQLTPDELRAIIAALQLARFPERTRPRPTITEFETLGALQERLRELLTDS